MITVPRGPVPANSGPKPSEEMLMLALAHMKDIGRLKQDQPDPTSSPMGQGKLPRGQEVRQESIIAKGKEEQGRFYDPNWYDIEKK